ncbi:MAG: hypothetical protein JRJ85_01170 [Deltaproteobacteria bacterium]|nr:hypothetical protein [Deltaproteobacteria bacterium]
MGNWEKRLVKIWTKKTQDYLDIDREYVDRELPLLKAEKRSVQVNLRKIEELIAKGRVLIDDLNEDLCHDLYSGHSLVAVGQSLLDKFGTRLEEGHSEGRRTIREFLERQYRIRKPASRNLFSLLEEVGTLFYQVDLAADLKDIALEYYAPEGELDPGVDPGAIHLLSGWWEIRA